MLIDFLFQVEFGAFPYPESFEGSTEDFNRSALGDQISFTCAGWCGSCGPISGPIRYQHSTEFSKCKTSSLYRIIKNEQLTKYNEIMYSTFFSFSCRCSSHYLSQVNHGLPV